MFEAINNAIGDLSKMSDIQKCGVIVGRFQVPMLTSGHAALIDHVLRNNDRIIIIIGENHVRLDTKDPLPKNQITNSIKEFMSKEHQNSEYCIGSVKDQHTNEYWSSLLDEQIKIKCGGLNLDITLYGGRDSFLKSYLGKHKMEYFESGDPSSGTEIRNSIYSLESFNDFSDVSPQESFRMGIIKASSFLFPTSFQCVDIIAMVKETLEIVVIQKKGSKFWQLPGGFVDVDDQSLEDAALRELKEETCLTGYNPCYMTSHRIDDFRYRGRRDKIMSSLFFVHLEKDSIIKMQANDDAFSASLCSVRDIVSSKLPFLSSHKDMIEKVFKEQNVKIFNTEF